jgi:hypothetical protein
MAGSALTVGEFTLTPAAGPPGSVVEFTIALSHAVPGLDSVVLSFAGEPLGEPIAVATGGTSVERRIPAQPPGEYEVALTHQGVALATSMFQVTDPLAAAGSPPIGRTGLVILLIAVIAVLAWRTLREVWESLPPGQRLGPVAAWRVRRGRRPVG